MLPAVRSVPPGGAGESESGTVWTGEKRRRTTRPSTLCSSDDDADMMDIQHHPPEDDSGLLVYSANDEISDEELDLCLRKVESREPTIDLFCASIHSEQEREELYERFCQLRMREYSKVIKPDDIHEPTGCKYPFELYYSWGDPCVPDRIFDWTIDDYLLNFAGLSDYQHIIPTRKDCHEYYDWDLYRLTISSYETDEDYVKYWDELSKRLKWVEEYQYMDDPEFSELTNKGFNQAMKIASEFSHLPYSLACRGYKEYLWYMRRGENCKDLDNIYFEIWKRVIKKKMGFRQALEEILAANMFPSHSEMIKDEIQGSTRGLAIQFKKCMEHIPKNVELDDVLGHIGHVIFELLIPKTYVYYVRKKLGIARRLGLTPGQLGLPTIH